MYNRLWVNIKIFVASHSTISIRQFPSTIPIKYFYIKDEKKKSKFSLTSLLVRVHDKWDFNKFYQPALFKYVNNFIIIFVQSCFQQN